MGGKTWVQGELFVTPAGAPSGVAKQEPAGRRLSYTRVTRDPDAALSYAESRVVAAQVTRGLAAAFARLHPDRQSALRAIFGRRPQAVRPT